MGVFEKSGPLLFQQAAGPGYDDGSGLSIGGCEMLARAPGRSLLI